MISLNHKTLPGKSLSVTDVCKDHGLAAKQSLSRGYTELVGEGNGHAGASSEVFHVCQDSHLLCPSLIYYFIEHQTCCSQLLEKQQIFAKGDLRGNISPLAFT